MNLDELLYRLRSSAWFQQLPEWLRDPPVLFVASSAVLLTAIFFVIWLARRRRRRDSVSRELTREIRELRRRGDELGVGQRWEALGEPRKALAAYRRGGRHAEYARLLLDLGERDEARRAARDGEVWALYGDLAREDEDYDEAGTAYERAGKPYDAARAWEAAGRPLKAAKCYAAVGMELKAVLLLKDQEGSATAEVLEKAIRSSAGQGVDLSPDMARAVHRCAQLWLSEGEPERAYRLAVETEQWTVAVPIARDYLDPDPESVEVCLRAGAWLAAAEIAEKLGDTRREALCRAEHFLHHDDPAEAARWFEKAEAWSEAADQWAAAGEIDRAAALYTKAEEFEQAAQLYAAVGDEIKVRAMRDAARARDPRAVLEAEEETRRVRPQAAPPTGETPVARPSPPVHERYRIEAEIGRGGMGVVYQARDLILDRTVAYKVLTADVTGAAADPGELLKEARAAARLSHPNIVQVYDAGPVEGGFFVVMELVHGENFAELLKKRKLSVSGAVTVARQICAALEHAHGRNIVHRDLKPSNLMWTSENQVKLTDFGLARFFESARGQVLTRPAGTPYYMAPEQIRGDPVDPRTDLYSFGCVLFELLTQRTPFAGGGSSIYHHLNSPPQNPRLSRQEIPEGLAAVILRCLEKDPGKRPRSAAELGRELAALMPSGEPTRG